MTEMVPGWRILLGTNAEAEVGLNALLAGGGYSSIQGLANRGGFPWEVSYSLLLVGDATFNGNQRTYIPYSLVQTGDIPSDARSIPFLSYANPVALFVNDNPISLFYSNRPPSGNPQTQQADAVGDISPFAGQSVELRFLTLEGTQSPFNGLDSIFFSPVPIPEPGTLVLFSLGGVILAERLRRTSGRVQ